MSKGKFEPGKRVLLLGPVDCKPLPWAIPHIGTVAELEAYAEDAPRFYGVDAWFLVGIGRCATTGKRNAWRQKSMILLDPDESPEQSAEAMRNLYSLPQKVTA